jgi:membrane associated rhomboid family serine protease
MDVAWTLSHRLAVVLTLVVGVVVALALDDRDLAGRLRARFLLGVPWGTLVVVGLVFTVYLLVQGGLNHWHRPVTIPFRAWSYLYPLGILASGFTHVSPGHLLGNLFGTLALAPLVEYAWGHYSRERGASTFGTLRSNPYVRAFVLFPAIVVATGVGLSLFAIGPVIGFSGVVFAFAGFALVRYPLGTIVAMVGSNVVNLTYRALLTPVTEASGRTVFVTPWWADVAIQGHALGLLVGIVLGVLFVQSDRGVRPPAARLFAGMLLFSVMQSLWAVYWFRGGTEFVLYRAVGLSLVAVLATLVTVGVAARDRPLFGTGGLSLPTRGVRSDGGRPVTTQQMGVVVLLLATAVVAGPAIPVNLVSAEGDLPGETVDVQGYEITYAENVRNGMVSSIPLEAFGETTSVKTSGVIVRNADREIWTTAVSKGRLAFSGRERVVVGGIGWRHELLAVRSGWTAAGGDTAYRVNLVDDGVKRTAFTSDSATADPIIGGRNVSVTVDEDRFYIVVASNESGTTTLVRAPMPGENESVVLQEVTFTRVEDRVVASYEGTEVVVLRKETYGGR